MSQRLVVFISSTVRDLEPVRRAIKASLAARQIEVRLSEDADFPVEPGVSSHDACLRAVRASHVFVLLVGSRFGGEYKRQKKSITWREWEEAMRAGCRPIVLVREDTNALAQQIFVARQALMREHAGETVEQIDARLRADPRFRDDKPLVHDLPCVQRFIDALRKGHVDNWMHADWDGTSESALERIELRLATMMARATDSERAMRAALDRERQRTFDLESLLRLAGRLGVEVRAGERSPKEAIERLLAVVVQQRASLFGFGDRDRYNFVVYRRRGETLVPWVREAHADIPRHGREWRVGQGHVGLAAQRAKALVSGDIRHADAWVPAEAKPTDWERYVSCVSVPFATSVPFDDPDAVLIVTSDRLDHFTSEDQVEVLTAIMLVNTFSLILSGTRSDP